MHFIISFLHNLEKKRSKLIGQYDAGLSAGLLGLEKRDITKNVYNVGK